MCGVESHLRRLKPQRRVAADIDGARAWQKGVVEAEAVPFANQRQHRIADHVQILEIDQLAELEVAFASHHKRVERARRSGRRRAELAVAVDQRGLVLVAELQIVDAVAGVDRAVEHERVVAVAQPDAAIREINALFGIDEQKMERIGI